MNVILPMSKKYLWNANGHFQVSLNGAQNVKYIEHYLHYFLFFIVHKYNALRKMILFNSTQIHLTF